MFEGFKFVFDFINSNEQKISHKFLVFIAVFVSVFLVDLYFNFSHDYKINNQIEQIKKIEDIIKDCKDTTIVRQLKDLEKKVISKHYVWDDLAEGFRYYYEYGKSNIQNFDWSKLNVEYTEIGHFVSVNFFFIFISVVFPFFMLFSKEKIGFSAFGALLIVYFFFGIIMLAWSAIFGIFQPLTSSPLGNYAINVVINVLILGFFASKTKKSEKKVE